MMPDDQDPSQLYTPGTLANQRLYAQALLQQGMGTITPSSGGAVSPFQGLAGILEGYQGRQLLRNSGPQEIKARARAAEAASPTAPGEEDQQPSGGPLTARPPGSSSMGYSDPISRYAAATSTQESGGNYNALGPVIKSPMTGQPDRAFGRYGVMGANVPQWTAEVLGKPMTPQEFLQNPRAQDAVYKAKFGQLAAKYGPEGAAKAWFAGEGGMNNPNAKDVNGMTVAKYGNNFNNALAFNGEPSGAPTAAGGGPLTAPPPGAPGSPALALQRPSMGLPSPSMAPATATGGSAQDQPSGTLPMRPRVSRQQFISSSNPWIKDADQQSVRDMYYSQNQPLQMQGPYGSTIIVNPRNPSERWVMPGPVQMEHTKAGDVEVPTPMVTMPPGSSVGPPNIQKIVPGVVGGAPQGSGPAPSSQGPADMPHDLVPPAATKATPFADEEGAAEGGLPDVITKGPEAAQAARGGGMLAFAPPGAPTAGATPSAAPAGQQVAQQGPAAPDLNRMSPGELANWSQNRDIQTAATKKFNEGDIDQYNKDYVQNQEYGTKAINAGQQIALAQKIIHDPHFTQGPGTDMKLAWEKAKAFMGDQGAQTNLAYNQAFDKVIASNILGSMRSALQGLGQVRVAEINLLNRAAAAQHNTIGANQAILDLAAKSQQQLQELGKITNWYRQGYRWDDSGKLITDQSGKPIIGNDRPTSAGQNAIVRTYLTNNPMLSDEQIKHYDSLFDAAEKGGGGVAQGPLSTKPPAAPAPVPQGMSPQQAAAAAAAEKLRRQQPQAQPEIPM